jgi:two-component system NtrC family sensor kinase
MAAANKRFRLSLQAKVLVAVLGFLVLLPVVTLWIVNDHMERQMEDEARQTLTTAEAVFLKSLDNRSRNILERYRSVVEEARFKVTAELGDRRTIDGLLLSVLEDSPEDHAALLYFNDHEEYVTGRRRSSATDLEKLAQETAGLRQKALTGEAVSGVVGYGGRVYSVVAVPVNAPNRGPLVGALTVAIVLGEPAVKELKLPRTEILLVADNAVVVSTVPAGALPQTLLEEVAPAGRTADARRAVVANEHFMARSGDLSAVGPGQPGIRYVMLSSYEARLQALVQTRRTVMGLSIAGILVSGIVVSWFVRRVTHPLRDLAETAEAVGRGDFSRRIERFSDDECGDLAQSFNRMTENLQTSRAELEKTVTTLKGTQAQLVQSEKLSAVGQFVAGVAHELNNPLTAVIGFADLLTQVSTDEKARPHLELIAKSAHRCHKIVQSLLSFARQHAPERKLVKLNAVIEEVLEIMAYDLRTSNIKVVTQFAAKLPVIMADSHQLQQVFVNILSNARQALQPYRQDGEIVIRTLATTDMVQVEFTDNGPGIAPGHLPRIFDPFFTTKPVGKGTGLGLSLSYGIIQEHGGRITARSEVGRGTTFAIELPVANDKQSLRPASAPPFTQAPRASGTGRSVLVVDDEEWIRELTRALLEQDGYTVAAVASGEAAVEVLRRCAFDVIVTDWKMPGMNGLQLYEHLATTDPVTAKRVLFMSGDVINDAFTDFLRRHGRTCLPKPFEIDEFRSVVAGVLKA